MTLGNGIPGPAATLAAALHADGERTGEMRATYWEHAMENGAWPETLICRDSREGLVVISAYSHDPEDPNIVSQAFKWWLRETDHPDFTDEKTEEVVDEYIADSEGRRRITCSWTEDEELYLLEEAARFLDTHGYEFKWLHHPVQQLVVKVGERKNKEVPNA